MKTKFNNSTSNLNYKIAKNSKEKKYKFVETEKYVIIPIETKYIEPNESLKPIFNKALDIFETNDYLVIAETPIAISQGRVVDEMDYEPSIKAKVLAIMWSKYLWGYILGPILKIKKRTIKNLRTLPEESKRHKEVVLQLYGWKHALKPASEAGIDLSNAPGTLVSLLPKNPKKVAKKISKYIKNKVGKNVNVLIIDTDATYKLRNKYFTGLPEAIEPIISNKGVLAYILGQLSKNMGSTPLGSSKNMSVEKALEIANIAEDYQKSLKTNMETIYSMKSVLKTNEKDISIKSLNSIVHTPAIIIREK